MASAHQLRGLFSQNNIFVPHFAMPDFYNYLASRNQKALYVRSKCSRFDLLREGQLALADRPVRDLDVRKLVSYYLF
jgi:hypothetical protein